MIVEQYPYTALMTALALVIYLVTILKVGAMRGKHKVQAPATDGPEDFQRAFRVQQNTVEQLILVLPALWLFAMAWGDMWAGLLGAVFCIGRILYARGYYRAAEKRALGFMIAGLTGVILLLGALLGAVIGVL